MGAAARVGGTHQDSWDGPRDPQRDTSIGTNHDVYACSVPHRFNTTALWSILLLHHPDDPILALAALSLHKAHNNHYRTISSIFLLYKQNTICGSEAKCTCSMPKTLQRNLKQIPEFLLFVRIPHTCGFGH